MLSNLNRFTVLVETFTAIVPASQIKTDIKAANKDMGSSTRHGFIRSAKVEALVALKMREEIEESGLQGDPRGVEDA